MSWRRLIPPLLDPVWLGKREAPTNLTHVAVTTGNILAAVTFVWGAIKYFDQKDREEHQRLDAAAMRSIDSCTEDARRHNPRVILSDMKRSMIQNFKNARRDASVERPWAWSAHATDVDELADRWIRKRNDGRPWALRVDEQRISLKNMWSNIALAWRRHPQRRETLQRKLLYAEYPLGREVAVKSLLMLEPLDRAACRANVGKTGPGVCDWKTHCPVIYPFIRSVYGIPDDWPFYEGDKAGIKSEAALVELEARVDKASPDDPAHEQHEHEQKRLLQSIEELVERIHAQEQIEDRLEFQEGSAGLALAKERPSSQNASAGDELQSATGDEGEESQATAQAVKLRATDKTLLLNRVGKICEP